VERVSGTNKQQQNSLELLIVVAIMVREAWKVSFTLLITLLALLPLVECGGTVVEVDSRSLPKIIEKHKRLLLVEFYAPSCGHCVRLDPELDRLAKDLEGKVTIVKIDSRGGGSLGQKYGVKGTPTMLLFYKGQEITAGRCDFLLLRWLVTRLITISPVAPHEKSRLEKGCTGCSHDHCSVAA
jgi:thiol-disulfide isomerase/thioredoxin